jgi:hypothetical protein
VILHHYAVVLAQQIFILYAPPPREIIFYFSHPTVNKKALTTGSESDLCQGWR